MNVEIKQKGGGNVEIYEWELAKQEKGEMWLQLKEGEKVIGLVSVLKGANEEQTLVCFYKIEDLTHATFVLAYSLKTLKKLIKKIEKEEEEEQ